MASGVRKVGHGVLPPPPKNGCMIVRNYYYSGSRSGETILKAENSGKPLGGRLSAPKAAAKAYSAPQTP